MLLVLLVNSCINNYFSTNIKWKFVFIQSVTKSEEPAPPGDRFCWTGETVLNLCMLPVPILQPYFKRGLEFWFNETEPLQPEPALFKMAATADPNMAPHQFTELW